MKRKFNIKLISIILPTYNEAENIVDMIKAIDKAVHRKIQLIVVDDNSPDGTSKIVKNFISRNKRTNVILKNRYQDAGLTNSIRDGIELAKGDVIIWLDCDFSMPPQFIVNLLKKIEDGYDIAVGSRFVKGGGFKIDNSKGQKDSPVAIALSRLMNFTIRLMLGSSFRDYTSGFIAAKRTVFDQIQLRGDYGEYFIDLIYKAKANKFKITEIGYICIPREKGESKTGHNILQFTKRGSKYFFLAFQLLIEKKILRKIP